MSAIVAQVTSLVFTFNFYQRLRLVGSSRQYGKCRIGQYSCSDSGGSEFAGFDEEETRRNIGDTTRVIGTARAAVGVMVSESDLDSSDATIVEITGTVIVKPIVHRKCTANVWFD